MLIVIMLSGAFYFIIVLNVIILSLLVLIVVLLSVVTVFVCTSPIFTSPAKNLTLVSSSEQVLHSGKQLSLKNKLAIKLTEAHDKSNK
jgi:hypothetical protein